MYMYVDVYGVTTLNNKLFVMRRSYHPVLCPTHPFVDVFDNFTPFLQEIPQR